MGRPIGYPGDRERQHQTLLAALRLFENADSVGTIEELWAA